MFYANFVDFQNDSEESDKLQTMFFNLFVDFYFYVIIC